MLNKTTKITSLLVAAATMASMTPAMAATKKLDTEDGTIYNAVAYKDGKMYLDGETEKHDEDAYYVSGGKYNDLEDVDSGDDVDGIYDEKYLEIDGGDYYINLENGKVTDDEIREDFFDDAATEIRKKIKKDNDGRLKDDEEAEKHFTLKEEDVIPGAKYAKDWFNVKYVGAEDPEIEVFGDAEGNYIDADYNIGKVNLTFETTSDSVSVTLENTVDDEEGVKASIDHNNDEIILGSDEKYIYRKTLLKIDMPVDKNNKAIAKTVKFGSKNRPLTTTGDAVKANGPIHFEKDTNGNIKQVQVQVIQKISKKEDSSDDVKGLNYAKDVTTYFLTGGKNKNNEIKDNRLGKLEKIDGNDTKYAVVGKRVLAYGLTDDGKFKVNHLEFDSSNGYYFFGDGDCDTDADNCDSTIDANGDLWVVADGRVKKYEDGLETKYRVDGSMDKISVYDDNNLVVWNEDDEVYAILNGKSKKEDKEEDKKDESTQTPAVKNNWVQNANGTWGFNDANGVAVKNNWVRSPFSGCYYFMDANGAMITNNWIQSPFSGKYFFMKADGAMAYGWIQSPLSGLWYYMDNNGAMVTNTTVNGYVLGANGAWIR